jgi:hypothetical protein
MTSRFTILLSMAGVLALGCSSPAEEGDVEDTERPAAPTRRPAFADAPQNPAPTGAAGNGGGQLPVTPEVPQVPVVQTPVTPQGAAGSTGMPPTPGAIPTGTGLALTPAAGFIAGASNEVGIQGYFYTFDDNADGGNSTILPEDFAMAAGSTICANGTAAQVVNGADGMPAYGTYWGAGIGLNLADPGTNMPGPWSRGKVVGFSFNVTGTGVPPAGQFRFKANFYDGTAINNDYCVNATTGANTFMLNQIVNACYTPGGAPLTATAQLQALQWQVATVTDAPTPFNYCIENLKAITSP